MSDLKSSDWEAIAGRHAHDSESRFHELADNISQFAWTADRTGWIYWYNKRWHDYPGATLEDMQGWRWQKVHHPEHVERVVLRIRQSFETGTPWEDTFPLRGRDGQYRWFLSHAQPIRNDAGDVIRWLGTNTDVTKQIEAENALRELVAAGQKALHYESRYRHRNGSYRWLSWTAVPDQERIYGMARDVTGLKEAEHKLDEAGRQLAQVTRRTTLATMTASIAHEINQPLGAIVLTGNACSRLLASPEPDLEAIRAALKRIVDDGRRASDILANIRSMLRHDHQQRLRLDMNDVVRDRLNVRGSMSWVSARRRRHLDGTVGGA